MKNQQDSRVFYGLPREVISFPSSAWRRTNELGKIAMQTHQAQARLGRLLLWARRQTRVTVSTFLQACRDALGSHPSSLSPFVFCFFFKF